MVYILAAIPPYWRSVSGAVKIRREYTGQIAAIVLGVRDEECT